MLVAKLVGARRSRRVSSERLLMEKLNYNLLLRGFVGLNIDALIRGIKAHTAHRIPRFGSPAFLLFGVVGTKI
ncbi:MAG TPA: hypothetical protein VGC19_15250 [Rhodanobacter sp.]